MSHKEHISTNENEHNNKQQNKKDKHKITSLRHLAVAGFIISKKIINSSEMFAIANEKKAEGLGQTCAKLFLLCVKVG